MKLLSNELERAKYLGVTLQCDKNSVYVSCIIESNTKLRMKDRIMEINGIMVKKKEDLHNIIQKKRENVVKVKIERENKTMLVDCSLFPYPKEEAEKITINYSFFTHKGMQFRTIITIPKHTKNEKIKNIVLFIQGIECDSVDKPLQSHPYKKILYGLTKGELMTARIDLYGNGDSNGEPLYTYGFYDILDLYKAAVKHLINKGCQVYILGYSIGGFIAPMIAEAIHEIKGIAVFDTIVTSLYDYLIKNRIRQEILQGYEREEIRNRAKEYSVILNKLLIEGKTPINIIRENSIGKQYFDDNDVFIGHTYIYAQQIFNIDIKKTWEKLRIPICLIVGERDYVIDYDEHISLYQMLRFNQKESVQLISSPIDHFFREEDMKFSTETVNQLFVFYRNRIRNTKI